MPTYAYIIIAVVLILALAVLFVWSFVAYWRTPAPKGCEDIAANAAKCSACGELACPYKKSKEGEK